MEKRKSLGQIAYEAASLTGKPIPWVRLYVNHEQWERVAAAVVHEYAKRLTLEDCKSLLGEKQREARKAKKGKR